MGDSTPSSRTDRSTAPPADMWDHVSGGFLAHLDQIDEVLVAAGREPLVRESSAAAKQVIKDGVMDGVSE